MPQNIRLYAYTYISNYRICCCGPSHDEPCDVLSFATQCAVSVASLDYVAHLPNVLCCTIFVATHDAIPQLGILHPVLLIYLLACSYLQSIYPLGLCMPGYLQWGRMWGYAVPALVLIFIYSIGAAAGSNLANVYTFNDIVDFWLSGDVVLRILCLLLSGYYIVNIFRLPHRLVRSMQLPSDLMAYGAALGIVSLFFVVITVEFNLVLLTIYILLFTLVNMFLFSAYCAQRLRLFLILISVRLRHRLRARKLRNRRWTTLTRQTCIVLK